MSKFFQFPGLFLGFRENISFFPTFSALKCPILTWLSRRTLFHPFTIFRIQNPEKSKVPFTGGEGGRETPCFGAGNLGSGSSSKSTTKCGTLGKLLTFCRPSFAHQFREKREWLLFNAPPLNATVLWFSTVPSIFCFDNRPCNGIWRENFLWLPGNLENMSHITTPSSPKTVVRK